MLFTFILNNVVDNIICFKLFGLSSIIEDLVYALSGEITSALRRSAR